MKRFTAGFALLALVGLAACAESATPTETKTKNSALGATLVNGDFTPTGGGWTGQGFTLDRGCGANTPTAFRPSLGVWAKNSLAFGYRAAEVRQVITVPEPSTVELAITGAVRTDDNRGWFSIGLNDANENMTTGQKTGAAATTPTVYKLSVTTTNRNEQVTVKLAGSGKNAWRGCYGPVLSKAALNAIATAAPTTTLPETTTTLAPETTTTTVPETTTSTVPETTTTTTTTIAATTTTVNPLACEITAIRTGGTGSVIPVRVTACRPMRYLNASYWLGGTRLTYVVALPVSNATTSEFDWFSKLSRYLGKPGDLPDSISLTPQFSDGSSMAAVRLPISTTLQSTTVIVTPPPTTTTTTTPPPTTTTTPQATTTTLPTPCAITLKGSILRACRAISYLDIEWWTDAAKINVSSRATKSPAVGYIEIVPVWSTVMPTRGYVKLRLDDGSELGQFFVPISKTADLKFNVEFSKGPAPTTTTLAPPPTVVPPGCDLAVRYGAVSSPCGGFRSYTYVWHDGSKTISGMMGGTRGGGGTWDTIYLGALSIPKAATGALMTFTFANGRQTSSVLVPLSTTTTIRAPFS